MMWVFMETEDNVWTVGFFTPREQWITESDHSTKDSAAERVHFLNGGEPV